MYNSSLIRIELCMLRLVSNSFFFLLDANAAQKLDREDSDGEILHIHNTKPQYEAFSGALRTP